MRRSPTSALALTIWLAACSAPPRCDLLIRGGTVVDGTGAEGRAADVWISGDRIVHVGPPREVVAGRTIDATGKVVTPGFIDPHAHGDPRRTPAFRNFVSMGVTTICLGQDGTSPGDLDFDRFVEAVRGGRIAVNIAPFVGHGTLRRLTGIDLDPNPREEQLAQLEARVDAAMRAGAFGLSTGLEYAPGRFARADELRRISKRVADHGGLVMSHIRSEDDDKIDAALRELFDTCAAAGCRAHVAHLKIVYGHGTERASEVLRALGEAGATADVYPYCASYTGIAIVFPDWALPPNDFEKVVATRRSELEEYLRQRIQARNGPEATLFGTGRWRGKTLADAAAELGVPFEQVLIDHVGPRGASAAYFVMDRTVMEHLLRDPRVMVSSDGSPTMRHPRGHGAFARIIREYVVQRRLLTLEQAVHKMTGLTARTLGLDDRGLLEPGRCADVLVFDPSAVHDPADFDRPFEKAVGIDLVLVNGVAVIQAGKPTEARPGKLLLREGKVRGTSGS